MATLTGIRVLDLTRLLPGPYGTMILADHGADVIKIEEPGKGDPMRQMQHTIEGLDHLFTILNRGKRSVTLNLRTAMGQSFFQRLLAATDILVEGFRPGVMQRLGLDYASLAGRYPGLVYCSISGFGQAGPRRDLPGHDLNYLGWAGLLSANPQGPEDASLPPTLWADVQAGLCAAFGIVLAIHERASTNIGRYVDANMTRTLSPFLLPGSGGDRSTSQDTSLSKPWFCGGLACYNVYRTADGKQITLAALEVKFWREFCNVAGRPDLADQHLEPLRQTMLRREVANIIAMHPEKYWLDISTNHDVCIGPVRTQAAALSDGSLRDKGWPDPFISTVRTSAAPELGADTRQVLVEELGCDPAEVQRGFDEGVL